MNYSPLFEKLNTTPFHPHLDELMKKVDVAFWPQTNSDVIKYLEAYNSLPPIKPSHIIFNDKVSLSSNGNFPKTEQENLEKLLKTFHPWRKGPYELFDIFIDTEWRSDWKWDRLAGKIQSLKDRKILDIGCGNGYHCWRMMHENPELVMGIDPFLLSVVQFWVIKHFLPNFPVWVLPLGIEDLPQNINYFDTVFSMGVLYHRRSPLDHLYEIRSFLQPNGELVLETLVIDGKLGDTLVPEGRYAKMRNVWFIPSTLTLELWLKRCGYKSVELIDVTPTTTYEQRSTEWMTFESLPNFLDPQDSSKTIEGYPAPVRAIFTATNPG